MNVPAARWLPKPLVDFWPDPCGMSDASIRLRDGKTKWSVFTRGYRAGIQIGCDGYPFGLFFPVRPDARVVTEAIEALVNAEGVESPAVREAVRRHFFDEGGLSDVLRAIREAVEAFERTAASAR